MGATTYKSSNGYRHSVDSILIFSYEFLKRQKKKKKRMLNLMCLLCVVGPALNLDRELLGCVRCSESFLMLEIRFIFKTDYIRPFTDTASNKLKGEGIMLMKSFYDI